VTEGRGAPKEWMPRTSILGRLWRPLVQDRKTLAGILTWTGIAILLGFIVVAVGAALFAPFDPVALTDEKDIPPLTNAPVRRNETFLAWTGTWINLPAAQQVDGAGARSTTAGALEDVTSFPLRILRDAVQAVGIAVLILPNGTDPGQYLEVLVSDDGGATWFPPYAIRTQGELVRVDITDLKAWTAAELSSTAFVLRLRHASEGSVSGNLTVDYVGATATWLTYWHLMGTDPVGRDVYSRVLHGARTSLAIMAIGVSVALLIGVPLGLYSGYRGGNRDKALVLVMDSLYSFPGLLLAGLIAVFLGKGVVNIGLAVTVIYIPLYFRVVRSQVLSTKEEQYVEAARAIGARPWRIIMRYIAFSVIVAIPVIFAISAADAVLTAAGLSYLGLGVEQPTPDWGLDLASAAEKIDNGIWWSSFYPGVAIVLMTVGLSFLGEGVNDLLNPLLRKERS